MSQSDHDMSVSQSMHDRLRALHRGFLRLHKLLLDAERALYEQEHGSVSNGEMLQLLLGNEHFAWLRTLSGFIIRIDEVMDAREGVSASAAQMLLIEAGKLLQPEENQSEFASRFRLALDREPSAVAVRNELLSVLGACA